MKGNGLAAVAASAGKGSGEVLQHTPGPWTIEEYGDAECPALVLHSDSETRICFMATPGSHGDPAIITANARLIAAAPTMYDLLKAGLEFWNDEDGDNLIEWRNGVRAAMESIHAGR